MVDVSARFRYNADFSPVQAQVRALSRDIAMLNASFVAMDKTAMSTRRSIAESFAANINATGQFRASFVDLTSATEQFGRAIEKRTLSLREYFREARRVYQQDSMATRLAERQVAYRQAQVIGMGPGANGRQGAMVVRPLRIDTSDYMTKMQLATEKYAIFNRLVDDGATKLINWGKNTQWAGRQLTVGLTMPLVLFGAAVSKTFRDVDKELTRFAKVYGSDLVGANANATEEMKRQIQSLAVEYARAYGIAAKETAALAADLAATGLEGEKLTGALAQTTRLAVLGEVDRQEAMQTTLALQSAFMQSTKELADSINFLNAVENQTSASLQDFTAAIPKAGPVVRQLGGDVKDLAVMLTAMREGGIPAAEAANAIKSGLASMINPTKAASERLAKLGVDIEGIVNRNRGQLMPTLMEFGGVINQLDSFARAKVIEELFGKYQFARISALFDNLNRQGTQTAQVLDLMGASSSDLAKIANKEIGALTESLSMRFTRAVEGFKAALLPIGEIMTASIIPFIEGATTVIGKMIDVFNALPEPVKNAGKFLLGLTAAAGPIIMLTGVFGNFLGYMTKGILTMNNFARRLMGLPVSKLEILDDQTIAAARATDILTDSFSREASSLQTLNVQLRNYVANLRSAAGANPAMFIPGSPARPLRRSVGGDIPGYGGGDKVPALLEPGEFVVRKEVASKNRGFLRDLNSGKVRRYQDGGDVADLDGRVEPFAARAHVLSPEEFYRLVQSDPDLRRMAQSMGLDLTGASGEKLVARGFGAYTSGIYPQFINNAFANERGIPDWMKNGIPFTPDETNQMIRVLESMPNRNPNQEATLQYLRDNFANKTRSQISTDIARRIAGATILQRGIRPGDALFDSELERETRRLSTIISNSQDPRYALARETLMLGGAAGLRVISTEAQKKTAGKLPRGVKVGDISPAFSDVVAYGQRSPGGRTTSGSSPTLRPSTRPGQALGPRGLIAARRHTAINLMPGEVAIPPQHYADDGAMIDSQGNVRPLSLKDAMSAEEFRARWEELDPKNARLNAPQRRGMMGSSLMNIGFAGSMLSGLTAMNGEVTAATTALTAFTTALMVAGTALELGQMFGGRGRTAGGAGAAGRRGFLGLRGAGAAMQARGVGLAANAGGMAGRLGGAALLNVGRGVAMLGGPIGIGIAATLTAAVVAYQLHQKHLEDLRKSATAAFSEASQTAEYFGITLGQTAESSAELQATLDQMGVNFSATADQIDQEFVQKVGSDYENLINRMTGRKDVEGIARDFELAYSSLISKGFGAEEANAILEEVARQAQQTEVYVNVKGRWQGIDTPEEAARAIVENIPETIRKAQEFLNPERMRQQTQAAMEELLAKQEAERQELERQLAAGEIDYNTYRGTKTRMALEQQLERERVARETVTGPDISAAEATLEMAPEGAAAGLKALLEAYKNAPVEVAPYIKQFNEEVAKVFENDPAKMEAYGGMIRTTFAEVVGDDPVLMAAFDKIPNTLEGIQQKTLLVQAANLGLKESIYGFIDEYGNIDSSGLDSLIQKTLTLTSLNERMDTAIQSAIDSTKQEIRETDQAFNRRIKKQEKVIEGLQDEAETAQDSHDAYMDGLDAESRALDKRAEKIQENADKQQDLIDKQIKSLQISQEESTFAQQQRERAFGILGALMSGDAGAYEQARLDYLQAQEDRQRELAIQGLEDRKEKIAEEADAKLDAIDKERQAIDERARAASEAHEAAMKQNQENQEAAQERIETLDKERNKIVKNLQAGINLLQQAKDQGYVTKTQATELNEQLGRIASRLPAGARKALTELSDGLFGPDGEYTRIVNGLITEMARALNVSEQDVRNMLGTELRGQYSDPNRAGAEGRNGYPAPSTTTGPGYSYIPGRAKGGPAPVDPMGMVRGPGTQTSDSILARLSKDEYVVRASSVNKIGKDTLDFINANGRLPGFAEGTPGGVGDAAGGFWGTGPNAMTILSIKALENVYSKAVSNIGSTTPGATGPIPSGEGSQWLANFLASMGLSGEQLRVAYAIAMRESSGQPNLISTMDGNGYGLFQIQFGVGHANTLNTVLGSNVTDNEADRQKFAELMFDPINNFKVMMHMSKNMEDLGAWGLYSWRNPTLNTRDYGGWTASQHQAWIMEPFLKYYSSFPGVDPSFTGTGTFPTGTVQGGGAAPGPTGAPRTLSGWPAVPPSVSGSYLTMTNSPSSNKEFYVAKWAVPMFEALMQSWQTNPLLGAGRLNLNSGSSGSYDYRAARASNGWSDHAAGAAVDFRYDVLPPFSGYQMSSAERSAVTRMLAGPLGRVFGWGGNYDMANMDEMHFYLKPNNGIIPAFARGGLVDIPGFKVGGSVGGGGYNSYRPSADRAEGAAIARTATSNPFIRGGGSYRGWSTGRAGAGFSAMGASISKSVSEQGIWGTIKGMASAIKEDPMSLIPFYGLSSIDTSTQEGKDILQAAAIMEILGTMPIAGLPFKGISMAGRAGTRGASSSVRGTAVSAINSPAARKILNPLAQRIFDRSNNKARQFLDATDIQQRNIGMNYDDAILGELIRRGDTPGRVDTPGLRMDYYGDNPIMKSAIGTFMKNFAYPRQSHAAMFQRSYLYGGQKRPISMYTRSQMEAAESIFRSIPVKDSDNFPLHPSYRAYLMEESEAFRALSVTDQNAVKNLWQRYGGHTEELPKNAAGVDYYGWHTGQINIQSPGSSLFEFLSTVGHEAGHTLDTVYGVSGRGGPGKYSAVQGKTEALAEANRIRSTSELLRSVGVTNPEYIMKPGGVQSYFPGVFLSGNKMQYGSSPLFKWHYARQMSKNLKGKQGPIFYPGKGFKMRGAGLYSDIIRSVPAWLAGKYLGYARGGRSNDNILARVSSGEYIMSAPAVKSIGIKNMDMINEGRLPGFNTGGFVGDPRFKLPKKKSLSGISESKTFTTRQGTNIEYNINIDVAQTNASADDIANRVMRTLRSNENSRRLRSNG